MAPGREALPREMQRRGEVLGGGRPANTRASQSLDLECSVILVQKRNLSKKGFLSLSVFIGSCAQCQGF